MLQKKFRKCLEAENIPLTDLSFYTLRFLDPYRYKSSHLTMLRSVGCICKSK